MTLLPRLPFLPALLLVATVSSVSLGAAAAPDPEQAIAEALSELRALQPMQPRQSYTLPAAGRRLTGTNDDFLRRRTADEIRQSGLSCGCGDYALVFLQSMAGRGFETLLVDSAQLSLQSLASTFSGHAVVAVRPPGGKDGSWWLVDSTARRILSRDWSPRSPSFTASGHVYWIGYCGPAEQYPARTPAELRKFYRDTLARVPSEFMNATFARFVFTVDASLRDESGRLLNPNVERLQPQQDGLLAQYRVKPTREIPVLLVRGRADATGTLEQVDGRWVARVGLRSACSPGFLTYMENVVRKQEGAAGDGSAGHGRPASTTEGAGIRLHW